MLPSCSPDCEAVRQSLKARNLQIDGKTVHCMEGGRKPLTPQMTFLNPQSGSLIAILIAQLVL